MSARAPTQANTKLLCDLSAINVRVQHWCTQSEEKAKRRVVDVYKRRKTGKEGRCFVFARFNDVEDIRSLEGRINQVWRSFKLRAKTARFLRPLHGNAHGTVSRQKVPNSYQWNSRSFANVVRHHAVAGRSQANRGNLVLLSPEKGADLGKIKVSSEEGKELASSKWDSDEMLNCGSKEPRFRRSFKWPKAADTTNANASGSATLIGQSHAREVEMSLGNCSGLLDVGRPNPRPPSILPPRRSSEFAALRVYC
ncbi:hypothetical protein Ancab_023524 [Ancistrocladus abbreviatus]